MGTRAAPATAGAGDTVPRPGPGRAQRATNHGAGADGARGPGQGPQGWASEAGGRHPLSGCCADSHPDLGPWACAEEPRAQRGMCHRSLWSPLGKRGEDTRVQAWKPLATFPADDDDDTRLGTSPNRRLRSSNQQASGAALLSSGISHVTSPRSPGSEAGGGGPHPQVHPGRTGVRGHGGPTRWAAPQPRGRGVVSVGGASCQWAGRHVSGRAGGRHPGKGPCCGPRGPFPPFREPVVTVTTSRAQRSLGGAGGQCPQDAAELRGAAVRSLGAGFPGVRGCCQPCAHRPRAAGCCSPGPP